MGSCGCKNGMKNGQMCNCNNCMKKRAYQRGGPRAGGRKSTLNNKRVTARTLDREGSKIERFVKKSDDFGNVIDWKWDGEMLEINTMSGVERYSRQDLKEARVFNRKTPGSRSRKFDGKEYYNDGFTYSNNKGDVQRVANRIRNQGNNARVVKTNNGYKIFQRPKQSQINAIIMENSDGTIYSATPYTTEKQKEVAINNAKAFKNRITGAYGGQNLAIMDGTIDKDKVGNWVRHKTKGRPYNFATPNMLVGMKLKKQTKRRKK